MIYIDDIIVTRSDKEHISHVKSILMSKSKMKDLGPLRHFLGVEVDSYSGVLNLSQRKYTMDISLKTRMQDCKPLSTPYVMYHKLRSKNGTSFYDLTLYHSIVVIL